MGAHDDLRHAVFGIESAKKEFLVPAEHDVPVCKIQPGYLAFDG